MDEILQSNSLACLLEYLNHPNGNVTCLVMDMLRYQAGSSPYHRQKMGSQEELVFGVLRILQENVYDRCKQQLGLSILSWLVEVETCRAILIRGCCVEHLFRVMDIYPWDDVVQCNATATLCWLLHSSPSSSITTTSPSKGPADSSLGASQHIVILMNTMRRFLMDAKVFGNTLSVLSGILLHQHALGLQSPPDYSSVDIVRLTLLGMRFHGAGHPKVPSNGLALLRILLAHGDEEEDEAGGGGGDSVIATVVSNIDILELCMKQCSEEAFIQAEACGILAYLVSSSSPSSSLSLTNKVRARIMESGCIETVIQAQMKHRGDVRLQHYALWFHSGLLRGVSSPATDAFGAGLPVLDTLVAEESFQSQLEKISFVQMGGGRGLG